MSEVKASFDCLVCLHHDAIIAPMNDSFPPPGLPARSSGENAPDALAISYVILQQKTVCTPPGPRLHRWANGRCINCAAVLSSGWPEGMAIPSSTRGDVQMVLEQCRWCTEPLDQAMISSVPGVCLVCAFYGASINEVISWELLRLRRAEVAVNRGRLPSGEYLHQGPLLYGRYDLKDKVMLRRPSSQAHTDSQCHSCGLISMGGSRLQDRRCLPATPVYRMLGG